MRSRRNAARRPNETSRVVFVMQRVNGRLVKLEKILTPAGAPRKSIRVVVSGGFERLDLANSTCERTRSADGTFLKEIVVLRGDMNDQDLEQFIDSFPIRPSAWR